MIGKIIKLLNLFYKSKLHIKVKLKNPIVEVCTIKFIISMVDIYEKIFRIVIALVLFFT